MNFITSHNYSRFIDLFKMKKSFYKPSKKNDVTI